MLTPTLSSATITREQKFERICEGERASGYRCVGICPLLLHPQLPLPFFLMHDSIAQEDG